MYRRARFGLVSLTLVAVALLGGTPASAAIPKAPDHINFDSDPLTLRPTHTSTDNPTVHFVGIEGAELGVAPVLDLGLWVQFSHAGRLEIAFDVPTTRLSAVVVNNVGGGSDADTARMELYRGGRLIATREVDLPGDLSPTVIEYEGPRISRAILWFEPAFTEFIDDIRLHQVCHMSGGKGANVLVGNAKANGICGREGPDRLRGRGGNDVVKGGFGNDRLVGGPGNDLLNGGRGADVLRTADGVSGNDTAYGGPGKDTCIVDAGDIVYGCDTVIVAS